MWQRPPQMPRYVCASHSLWCANEKPHFPTCLGDVGIGTYRRDMQMVTRLLTSGLCSGLGLNAVLSIPEIGVCRALGIFSTAAAFILVINRDFADRALTATACQRTIQTLLLLGLLLCCGDWFGLQTPVLTAVAVIGSALAAGLLLDSRSVRHRAGAQTPPPIEML